LKYCRIWESYGNWTWLGRCYYLAVCGKVSWNVWESHCIECTSSISSFQVFDWQH